MMQTTDVREAARGAVKQSKSFIARQVDERTTQAGARIGTVAQDMRNVGDQLRRNETIGAAADYVDQGADVVDRLGRYLQDASSEQMIDDLERLARKQPWAIATSALVLGFAVSRFLKTSSARRYRAGFETGDDLGYSSTYDTPTGIRSGGERYAT